jgi:hypothetical protein
MRLYLLYLGTMQPGEVPVPGYLIQTADGINILVDTGWPRSFVDHPQNPPGLSIEIRPEDTVSARRRARKLLRTPTVVRRVNRTAGGVMVGAGFAVVAAR